VPGLEKEVRNFGGRNRVKTWPLTLPSLENPRKIKGWGGRVGGRRVTNPTTDMGEAGGKKGRTKQKKRQLQCGGWVTWAGGARKVWPRLSYFGG